MLRSHDTHHSNTRATFEAEEDSALDDLHATEVQCLLRGGLLRAVPPPARGMPYPGETPIEGRGAVGGAA